MHKKSPPKTEGLKEVSRLDLRVLVAIAATATAATVAIATATTTATISAAEAATTAAATAEATTTAAATTKATAARAIFLGTSFVDREGTTTEVFTVQGLGCLGGIFRGVHGDKREATRATGHFVHRDEYVGDVTELSERVAQLVFGGFKGHVPYI